MGLAQGAMRTCLGGDALRGVVSNAECFQWRILLGVARGLVVPRMVVDQAIPDVFEPSAGADLCRSSRIIRGIAGKREGRVCTPSVLISLGDA